VGELGVPASRPARQGHGHGHRDVRRGPDRGRRQGPDPPGVPDVDGRRSVVCGGARAGVPLRRPVARYRISEDLAKYLRRRGRPNTSVDPRGPRGRK